MSGRLERLIRSTLRKAGRTFEESRRAFRGGRSAVDASRFDLPTDEEGRARVVCRRHAEKRAVWVDAEGRPECYDDDHPDCRGCAEDVAEGIVETW